MKNTILSMLTIAAFAIVFSGCAQPPQDAVDTARVALDAAASSEADRYVPELFLAASDSFSLAQTEIEAELAKSSFSRNYDHAAALLQFVSQSAAEAETMVAERKEAMRQENETLFSVAESALVSVEELITKAPRGKDGLVALVADRFVAVDSAWSGALRAWRSESRLPAAFRDYDSVAIRLRFVASTAADAWSAARHVTDSLRTSAQNDLSRARRIEPELEHAAAFFPNGFVDRRALVRGQMYESLARAALSRADVVDASTAARRSVTIFDSLRSSARSNLRPMLQLVDQWNTLEAQLLASRLRPVIVVDKVARKLFLHSHGRVDTFEVELGSRWLGPKRREGDRATPEGLYRVTSKLGAGESAYHRALVINYPNQEDRIRFSSDRETGLLPQNARIGGNIEIHGGGGRLVDWTDGCIAVTDEVSRRLFAAIPVGTPVLIAGSLSNALPLSDRTVGEDG